MIFPCSVNTRILTRCLGTRRFKSDARVFQENDPVILRRKDKPTDKPIFISKLKCGDSFHTHRGIVKHDDLIGRSVRDLISLERREDEKTGPQYRIHEVRLDEYVTRKTRLVTPLYPQDAQLIVSLLDLHPDPTIDKIQGQDDERLEILEAGTGHGGLTIYLSRAIHAANPPRPQRDSPDHESASWKFTRRAIIHSVEVSEHYSKHAERIVKAFRGGMYHGNVDFHVDDVGTWVSAALKSRGGDPFLSHALLDLPCAHDHIKAVTASLKTDGTLLIFTPSISQIMDVIKALKVDELPMEVHRVIELGVNGGSGGRDWEVRPVVPRRELLQRQAAESSPLSDDASHDFPAADGAHNSSDAMKESWRWICRPRVGELVVGGGFLVLLRKLKLESYTEGSS